MPTGLAFSLPGMISLFMRHVAPSHSSARPLLDIPSNMACHRKSPAPPFLQSERQWTRVAFCGKRTAPFLPSQPYIIFITLTSVLQFFLTDGTLEGVCTYQTEQHKGQQNKKALALQAIAKKLLSAPLSTASLHKQKEVAQKNPLLEKLQLL
eukprot:TRINITY_DN33340_c0_g1_i1.p2 TRINITY_DN33340_c0_g1~~TRINITY_DN33340_c0_g1_i1.p2  ORF type:complete len:152 (-),score=25.68 TRINITY_DN33340_c0_g1_i1:88-543(-)